MKTLKRTHFPLLMLGIGLAIALSAGCSGLTLPTGTAGNYGGSPSPSPSTKPGTASPTPGNGYEAEPTAPPTDNPDAVAITGHWGMSLTNGTSYYWDVQEYTDDSFDGTAVVGGVTFKIDGQRTGTTIKWTLRSPSGSTVRYEGVESLQGRQIKGTMYGSSTLTFVAIRH